jgi:PAS domain S-box-containing protein
VGGNIVGVIGVAQDVTEVREQEKKTLANARELRLFVDTANAPIFGIDVEGRVNEWNNMTAITTGFSSDEAFGLPLLETFITDETKDEVRRVLEYALTGSETSNYEVKFRTKDGSIRNLLVNASTRRGIDGVINGVVGVAQDITDYLNEKAYALREHERAETERAMNAFLAHEVRNPLSVAMNAINFTATSLKEGAIFPSGQKKNEVQSDLRLVRKSLEYINELLSNLLDLTKSEENKLILVETPCSLSEDVLEPVQNMLQSSNHPVNIEIMCSEQIWVHVDTLRLKQVVMNLAKNAIKFVEIGFVRLVACQEGDNIVISVEDSGPGVPPHVHDQLFQSYRQLSAQQIQGSGLGLALSKAIAKAMNGDLFVDPTYDSGVPGCPGCRFTLLFPAKKVKMKPHPGRNRKKKSSALVNKPLHLFANRKMLLVDDDDALAMTTARRFLKLTNHTWAIDVAKNVDTAEKMFLEKDIDHYDIILSDHFIAGGKKNGGEFISYIADQDYCGVLVGSSGNDLAIEHTNKGAIDFFRKPIFRDEKYLVDRINQLLPLPRGLRVLIAEDSRTNVMILKRMVANMDSVSRKRADYTVDVAVTGTQGVQMINTAANEGRPYQIAFVDYYLGDDILGPILVRRLKEIAKELQTVVVTIALSADANIFDEMEKEGCNLFFEKPPPSFIEEKIKKAWLKDEAKLQDVASHKSPPRNFRKSSSGHALSEHIPLPAAIELSTTSAEISKTRMCQSPSIPNSLNEEAQVTDKHGFSELLGTLEYDMVTFEAVIGAYRKEMTTYLEMAASSLEKKDITSIKEYTHKIKGTVGSLELKLQSQIVVELYSLISGVQSDLEITADVEMKIRHSHNCLNMQFKEALQYILTHYGFQY